MTTSKEVIWVARATTRKKKPKNKTKGSDHSPIFNQSINQFYLTHEQNSFLKINLIKINK
jgi:hypothetical protein